MNITAITSCWNSALWLPYAYQWLYPIVDTWVLQEANWTSDDTRWAGNTSPDGSWDIIQNFPDPDNKIKAYQLGKWDRGCLAARAELCAHIPTCDWVYIADVDEFNTNSFINWIQRNLPEINKQRYTTLTQSVRSFYWDFYQHTQEQFTRWHKWYPGINPWTGRSPYYPKDYHIPTKFGKTEMSEKEPGGEIFHYSYVPVPGVEIKGAESFDVPREKYKDWYNHVYSTFNGDNLKDIYEKNGGGVHVFGGLPISQYFGEHPEVLHGHPLRYAIWTKNGYVDLSTNGGIDIEGWWNK